MNRTEEIRRAFCAVDRHPLVALDWRRDIVPMMGNGENARLLSLKGDSVPALVAQLKAEPQLSAARCIAFEFIVNPDYELPFSDIAPLSDHLAALSGNPEIIWGFSRAPQLHENLKLTLLIVT